MGSAEDSARREMELVCGARAASTEASQRLGWRLWCTWNALKGRDPLLKIDTDERRKEAEDRVLASSAHCARVMGWGVETVKGRIGAVSTGHVLLGKGDPLRGMERLQRLTSTLRREEGPREKKLPAGPKVVREASAVAEQVYDRIGAEPAPACAAM